MIRLDVAAMAERSDVSRAGRKDTDALVRAAAAGKAPAVCLIVGEPHDTHRAAQQLIEVLVPAASRSLNLEVYDGRTTPLDRILDSLRMPGFFAGTKVLWVRESGLFLSGEKKSDVAGAMFAAWQAGREKEAAEMLLSLLALAGWTDADSRNTDWASLTKTKVRDVVGEGHDAEALDQLAAIHRTALALDLRIADHADDASLLLQLVEGEAIPGTLLLFTAVAVDGRKRVVKRLQELGAVVHLEVERERSGALKRESVTELAREHAQRYGKRFDADALELVTRRTGSDAASLSNELDKVCLYVGDRPNITQADVRAVFLDMAESWIFDFTAALAERSLSKALPLLRNLLGQGEPPLRLLAMVAREVRQLLAARDAMDGPLASTWRRGTQFSAFQSRVLPAIDEATKQLFGKVHPFVLFRRFQDAERHDARRLRRALIDLADIDMRFKTGRGDPVLLLESFLIAWCR